MSAEQDDKGSFTAAYAEKGPLTRRQKTSALASAVVRFVPDTIMSLIDDYRLWQRSRRRERELKEERKDPDYLRRREEREKET